MLQRLRNLALRDFVRLFPSLQFVQSRKLLTCFILLQTLFCQSIAGGAGQCLFWVMPKSETNYFEPLSPRSLYFFFLVLSNLIRVENVYSLLMS